MTAMGIFGVNVIRKRAQLRLSQARLAELASVSRAVVSKIEGGDGNVTVATLEKIAAALHCRFPELFVQSADQHELDEHELVRRAGDDRSAFLSAEEFLKGITAPNDPRYSPAGRRRRKATVAH